MTRWSMQGCAPRRWLGVLLLSCAFACGAHAAQRVVVVTSYAQEVISRIEAEFTRANPDLALDVIWRMPRDAMPYLQSDAGKSVDVYWSASGRNFAELAELGAFAAQPDLAAALPATLAGFELSDPKARYVASEVALYGFAVNPEYLARHGLPEPANWRDLADPRYRGHLLFPLPSRVGFAPLMIEGLLQRLGWNEGWALINEIASNAALWSSGGAFITEEVANANKGVAVTIDFFAASAIANGAPMRFVYPDMLAVSPGHVGILRNAPNAHGARRFVAFLLSEAGQRALLHPDVRKLPVHPDVFKGVDAPPFDPYAAPLPAGWRYDTRRGAMRLVVDNAVFDALITAQGAAHAQVWQALRTARAAALARGDAAALSLVREVETAALRPPIDEAQSHSAAVRAGLGGRAVRGGTEAPPEASALSTQWQAAIARQYADAVARLEASGMLAEGWSSQAGIVQ